MGLDLTLVVLDIFISIVLIVMAIVFIPKLANRFGVKLTIFKVEKLTKKEQLNNLADEKELLKAREKYVNARSR